MTDWKQTAMTLPMNTQLRIKCCNKNDTAIISRNQQGISFFCFRCDKKLFKPIRYQPTYEELQATANLVQKPCEMPPDASDVFEEEGLLWLVKYGVSASLRSAYGIKYSKIYKRVLLPVYENKRLVFLQCRAVFSAQSPKYINKKSVHKPLFITHRVQSETVVLTEDILSAIKVGEVYNSIALLGTSPPLDLLNKVKQYKRICLWFDDDAAGKKAIILCRRLLGVLGIPIYNINTSADPKEYEGKQIEEIIDARCNSITNSEKES